MSNEREDEYQSNKRNTTDNSFTISANLKADEVHYTRTGVRILTICFGATHTHMTTMEKIDSFDPVIGDGIPAAFQALNWQSTENAALGVREVYKNGKSGSVWLVTSGKPSLDVTDKYVQGTALFHDIVFD